MSFSLADAIELDVMDMVVEGTHFPIAVAPLKDIAAPLKELKDAEFINADELYGMLRSYRHYIREILVTRWQITSLRYLEVIFAAEQFGGDFSEFFRIDAAAFGVLVNFASLPSETEKVCWQKDGF